MMDKMGVLFMLFCCFRMLRYVEKVQSLLNRFEFLAINLLYLVSICVNFCLIRKTFVLKSKWKMWRFPRQLMLAFHSSSFKLHAHYASLLNPPNFLGNNLFFHNNRRVK